MTHDLAVAIVIFLAAIYLGIIWTSVILSFRLCEIRDAIKRLEKK